MFIFLFIILSVFGFSNTNFPFTGKITANKVRVRTSANLDSTIVKTVDQNALFYVMDETNGFYAVKPSLTTNLYIYKKYVTDEKITANKINVRLKPSLDSPILGQLIKNQKVVGKICKTNNQWLEIIPPKNIFFYISKNYVSKTGDGSNYSFLKNKEEEVEKLLQSAMNLAGKEREKPFNEMNLEDAIYQFEAIIKGYGEFEKHKNKAKEGLLLLKDSYLQKKIAFLEKTASLSTLEKEKLFEKIPSFQPKNNLLKEEISFIKTSEKWMNLEKEIFQSWQKYNAEKSIKDFYEEQKANGIQITGILEKFSQDIQKKPGNYILKSNDPKKVFLYSTIVDLEKQVGKKITILAAPRPNNNFAFPAYFVTSLE